MGKVKKTGKSQHNSSTKRKPKFWAVMVGVNRYRDREITNLSFCANDAVGLATALQQVTKQHLLEREAIFEDATILVHCDAGNKGKTNCSPSLSLKSPERENILASLDIFAEAQPEDTILFYFSGHGDYDENTLNTILCVPETEKDNLSQTGLLIKTVLAKITASAAKQQLIWLDACHSGSMGSQLIDAILQVTKDNPKIYAITSCDRQERSLELSDLGHGLFTYHLIQGLQGKLANPVIKLDELYHYVYYQTLEHIDRTNQLARLIHSNVKYQSFSPQRFAIGSGEFILGLNSPLSADRISRGALVLDGIKPSELALNLSSVLASKGGFSYQPYPHAQESIKDSISALIGSPNTLTALLYLKGKFLTIQGASFFVFDDGQKISKDWLAQQLADSAVEQQIIIVDCSQISQIQRQIELFKQPNKSQCIVAASTENDWLGKGFLEIINNSSLKGLTGTNLIDRLSRAFYARGILSLEQRVFYRSDKGIINVILPPAQQLSNVVIDRNYCPYKGLEAFTSGDRDFFFGRENLIQEIIARLETDSFVPVVGASGSGKSSIVQAGVIPQLLEEGLFIAQDNRCKTCLVWNLRPGEKPLQALANALDDRDLNTIEGILHLGVESFVAWLRRQPQPMGVLIIDQFEELFTQASEVNRSRFLELILGAVIYAGDRFKIIITLRNDFMSSCLAIPELGEIVKQNPLFVPSYLTEEQYRQIVVAPATRVGLAVQPELVDVLVSEVSTEKGALPLLEFTLERLWQSRDLGKLSLRVYQEKIGGIKKVLQERADSIYQELTTAQQECAQWIFTQLVSLGEGQEDTRRRRYLSELIVPKYSQKLIVSTLNVLRNARLIVMSDLNGDAIISQRAKAKIKETDRKSEPLELSSNSAVTIEIAHEILIRNWQQLRWWLDENREQIRLRERIEAKAAEWQVSGQKTDYLIRGAALAQAEEFYLKYADELPKTSQRFIYNSIEERDKQAKLAKRRRRQLTGSLIGGIATLSMLAGAAFWQLRKATINEINALNNSAEALLASNQELDALVTGLKAGKKLQNSWFNISNTIQGKTLFGLQNVFYQIKEVNRLEGHIRSVDHVAWSPDGKILASGDRDGIIKLWNRSGKLVHSFKGHKMDVVDLKWSPDGRMLASSGNRDGIIKLWNTSGKLIHSLENNFGSVLQIAWSPDGKTIAFVDWGEEIKLWNLSENLVSSLEGHTDEVRDIAWSPDGKTIASSSEDRTIKLWSISGELLHSFEGHTLNNIEIIAWSPDGKTIASTSSDDTIKLWSVSGELLHSFEDNFDGDEIVWSPNGKIIASATEDNIIKLWSVSGELLDSLSGHSDRIDKIVWSPDSKTIASIGNSKNGTVKIWSVKEYLESVPVGNATYRDTYVVKGRFLYSLSGHTYEITEVAWSPDSKTIASASKDRTIRLWSVEEKGLHFQNTRVHARGFGNDMIDIAWNHDGKTLASVSGDGTIKLWKTELEKDTSGLNGQTLASVKEDWTIEQWTRRLSVEVAWSPDGKTLASVSGDNIIKLWNEEGKLLRYIKVPTDGINEIAWSPDGQKIASVSPGRNNTNNTIKLWSVSGELLHSFETNSDYIDRLMWSLDGKMLASSNNDETKLWTEEGKLLHSLKDYDHRIYRLFWDSKIVVSSPFMDDTIKLWNEGKLYSLEGHTDRISELALNHNNKNLASSSSDGTIKLWSEEGELLHSFKHYDNLIHILLWSPDGKMLASNNGGNTIKIWSEKGKLLHSLEGHTDEIRRLTWNPNSKFLASSSIDGTVKLWSLDSNSITAQGCDWAQDYLTNNLNVSEEDRKICDGIE